MSLMLFGHSGDLVWAWKNDIAVDRIQVTQNWIHLKTAQKNGQTVLMTVVYGPSKVADRRILWEFIEQTIQALRLPWMLIRDFNQVLYSEDKFNSSSSLYGLDLAEAIFSSSLVELKSWGYWYIWTNNREGNSNVWEKIDRCFVNESWLN